MIDNPFDDSKKKIPSVKSMDLPPKSRLTTYHLELKESRKKTNHKISEIFLPKK